MKSRAFTLIELLVVVLIIGILSAIALPQYERAVEKTRAAQAMITLHALHDAAEVYYLTNGVYPGTFEELGVERPSDSYFSYGINQGESVFADRRGGVYGLFFRWNKNDKNRIVCGNRTPEQNIEEAKKICQYLGADISNGTETSLWGRYPIAE